MSRIILGNGKVIDGLRWSGNTAFSVAEVKASDFAGGLVNVKVEGTDEEFSEGMDMRGEYGRVEVFGLKRVGKYYTFGLVPASAVSEVERLRADLDYAAVMLGVDLDV